MSAEQKTQVSQDTVDQVTGALSQLFQTPKLAKDRIPLLNGVFEKLDVGCAQSIKDICAAPSHLEFHSLDVVFANALLEQHQDHLAVIFYSQRWGSQVFLMLTRSVVKSLVNAMFGGDQNEAEDSESEDFGALDVRVAQEFSTVLTNYLKEAFEELSPTDFSFERTETELEAEIFGEPDTPYVVTEMSFHVMEQVGKFYIVLPQGPLYAVRDKLQSKLQAGTPRSDEKWKDGFRDGVMQTPVVLEAAMTGPDLALQQLSQLHVGAVIELPLNCQNEVRMSCGEEKLFLGRLGKANGHFTVGVDQAIGSPQKISEDLAKNLS